MSRTILIFFAFTGFSADAALLTAGAFFAATVLPVIGLAAGAGLAAAFALTAALTGRLVATGEVALVVAFATVVASVALVLAVATGVCHGNVTTAV